MAQRDTATLTLPWPSFQKRKRKLSPMDGVIFGIVVALSLFGLVMVFSASAVGAEKTYQDSMFFLKRQVLWLLLGFSLLHLASRIDYRYWKKFAYPLLAVAAVSLVMVLQPSMGVVKHGARRWLQLGPLMFQPVEFAKLFFVLFLAAYLTKKEGQIKSFMVGLFPLLLIASLFALVILLQPDFGSVVVIGLVMSVMLFLGGASLVHLLGLALTALPIGFALVWQSDYRRERLLTFLHPWADPLNSGFQITQSFLAFGHGGPFGVGLGESKQKLGFLPEGHTDFVLALVGEELGLLGTAAVMVLFAVIVLRGMRIASRAKDPFGQHLAHGIVLLIGMQALINAGVVTGLLPTKGMTLPFVSYGGSSLVVTLFAIGVLLNISRDRQGGKLYGR